MSSDRIKEALTLALERSWDDGSPVAGSTPDKRAEMAERALRRINSFARRRVAENNIDAQVRDLAKGLVQAFERDPNLVGPLIVDYEYVSKKLIETYRSVS